MLPSLLHKIQTLPITVSWGFFKQMERLIFGFVWTKKGARLKRAALIWAKDKGEISMSDIYRYYVATHLHRIIEWCTKGNYKQ